MGIFDDRPPSRFVRLAVRISAWQPSGTFVTVEDAWLRLDDPAGTIIPSAPDGNRRLCLVPTTLAHYGDHAILTIVQDGEHTTHHVTLGPDLDVDLPVLVPTITRRSGLVRVEGKCLRDDAGLFHPLGVTWFWALQAYRSNRDRFHQTADYLASQGFQYPRILCEVAGGQWSPHNEIRPKDWPDYQGLLAGLMDSLWLDYGMRVELCVLGKGTGTDPIWLAQEIVDVLADAREHMVVNVEMCNESFSGDAIPLTTLQRMAGIFKSRIPNVLALSSPPEGPWDAMDAATRSSGAHALTAHLRRKMSDNGWAHVRQGYDCKNTDLVVLNNEPAGPGSSVATLTDPLLLAMTRAVSVMCGGAGFVFHTGTGVFGDGRPHPHVGDRPANFWEIPNIAEQIAAVRNVGALLPEGIENWSVKNTQRSGVPFDVKRELHWGEGVQDSSGWGVNKAYAAVSPDGRFVQMPCGVKADADHPFTMTAQFDMTNVTVYDPLTLEPIIEGAFREQNYRAGDKVFLPGQPDAHVAYIIHGQQA